MALQVCERHVDACVCVFVHVYGTDVLRTRVYVEVRAVFRHQFFLLTLFKTGSLLVSSLWEGLPSLHLPPR